MNNEHAFRLKVKAMMARKEQVRAANAAICYGVSPDITMLQISAVRWGAMLKHFQNWRGTLEFQKED